MLYTKVTDPSPPYKISPIKSGGKKGLENSQPQQKQAIYDNLALEKSISGCCKSIICLSLVKMWNVLPISNAGNSYIHVVYHTQKLTQIIWVFWGTYLGHEFLHNLLLLHFITSWTAHRFLSLIKLSKYTEHLRIHIMWKQQHAYSQKIK